MGAEVADEDIIGGVAVAIVNVFVVEADLVVLSNVSGQGRLLQDRLHLAIDPNGQPWDIGQHLGPLAPATDTRLRRIASLSQHNRSLRRVALLTLLLGDKLKRLGAS